MINNIFICGYIGSDVEIACLANSQVLTSVPIAVDFREKDQTHTEWIECTFWGKQAERLAGFAKKGDRLIVSGRMAIRIEYDKVGNMKKYIRVTGNQFQIIPRKTNSVEEKVRSEPNNHY